MELGKAGKGGGGRFFFQRGGEGGIIDWEGVGKGY